MQLAPIPSSSSPLRRPARAEASMALFLSTTYRWMALGLALTGAVAWTTAHVPAVYRIVVGMPMVRFGLCIAELAMVMAFSRQAARVRGAVAASMFLGYSALNGLTLSVLFMQYSDASLAQAFLVSAAAFAALSAYGATTERDLSAVGQFMFVGMVGFLLASVANIWLHSPAVYWVTTYAGVLIFAGLTAYHNQLLKHLYIGSGGAGNLALNGALMLYLDFLNMFLMALRFFGGGRRD